MDDERERWITQGVTKADTISLGFNTKSRFRSLSQPLGRVLDRKGSAIPLVVTPEEETIDRARWLSGSLSLAPLTTGDYLLELTKRTEQGEAKALVPFRVVR